MITQAWFFMINGLDIAHCHSLWTQLQKKKKNGRPKIVMLWLVDRIWQIAHHKKHFASLEKENKEYFKPWHPSLILSCSFIFTFVFLNNIQSYIDIMSNNYIIDYMKWKFISLWTEQFVFDNVCIEMKCTIHGKTSRFISNMNNMWLKLEPSLNNHVDGIRYIFDLK